jgi:hypothetical protein
MDGRRFDELTRQLGRGTASRRGVLWGGLATTLAALPSVLQPQPSRAVQNDPRCGKSAALLTNRSCIANVCSGGCDGTNGLCGLTVAGARECVRQFNTVTECPTTDECDRDADCGTGKVCGKVGGCCCPQGMPKRRLCTRRNKCLIACA